MYDSQYRNQQCNRRKTGAQYEQKAGIFLMQKGYQILEYNYRCRKGEIDIVAREGGYLVFCEVKYRKGTESGYASEAVDAKKQRILSKCALYYLMEKGHLDVACRFDVVCFEKGEPQLIKDAFSYTG